jgi:hypothetical protein
MTADWEEAYERTFSSNALAAYKACLEANKMLTTRIKYDNDTDPAQITISMKANGSRNDDTIKKFIVDRPSYVECEEAIFEARKPLRVNDKDWVDAVCRVKESVRGGKPGTIEGQDNVVWPQITFTITTNLLPAVQMILPPRYGPPPKYVPFSSAQAKVSATVGRNRDPKPNIDNHADLLILREGTTISKVAGFQPGGSTFIVPESGTYNVSASVTSSLVGGKSFTSYGILQIFRKAASSQRIALLQKIDNTANFSDNSFVLKFTETLDAGDELWLNYGNGWVEPVVAKGTWTIGRE